MTTYTKLISVAQLADGLSRPGLRVVDCRFDLFEPSRGRRDYVAGHIPTAVYAHLDDDLAAPVTPDSGRHPLPDPASFAATLERLGVSDDSQVVAYDGGPGALAARLWWMLKWLGHESVAVLDGGFAAWRAAGRELERGTPPAPARGSFRPRPRMERVLGTAELAAALDDGRAPTLIDAREAARFRGESEPIDSAAGHVPGALNFPFAQNIGADGRWRTPAELRTAWEALLGDTPLEDWAVMCGSGVTACHLALSADLAGLPGPRLYAGSWSEWIRDPARPRVPAAGAAAG